MAKFAVIEVGSNGVRYELGEASGHTSTTIDRRTKREDLTAQLSKFPGRPDMAMQDTVEIVKTYEKLAKNDNAAKIDIVGTEVCRKIEAVDDAFWKKFGIDLRVLTPAEEAHYGFKSAEATLGEKFSLNPRTTIDVGNGSTDIFHVTSGGEQKFLSWQVGAASLEKAFRDSNGSIQSEIKKIPDAASEMHQGNSSDTPLQVVIMGGLITKISWISFRNGPQERYRSDRLNGYKSSILNIDRTFDVVFDELKTGGIAGARTFVDPYEAETWKLLQVLSGCKYFGKIAETFGFSHFTVCGSSLRHGVMAELAENL